MTTEQLILKKNKSPLMLVIGVGGAGIKAADFMFINNDSLEFLAIDTDSQLLNCIAIPPEKHLLIGSRYILNEKEGSALTSLLLKEKQIKIAVILVGLGGETGSNLVPVIAGICRNLNLLTIVICSVPYFHEGSARQNKAIRACMEAKTHADAVFCFTNDCIHENYGHRTNLKNAFVLSNLFFKKPVDLLFKMLNSSGLFWIDLHDLHLLLDNSGWAILLEGTGVGENRTKIIIEELFQKQPFTNLLNEKGVKQLIFFLESGNNEKDQISFTDLEEISDAFYQRFGKELDIIAWSITADSSLGKKMRLSVLMNGEFEINPYQRSS